MKLKKMLKRYDIKIEKTNSGYTKYCFGKKEIFKSQLDSDWVFSGDSMGRVETEEQAVAWLIEGATPLSLMERAMKKWPIKIADPGSISPLYYLGNRRVFQVPGESYWLECDTTFDTPEITAHYTEKEAVQYLVEGYEEPKPPKVNVPEYRDTEFDLHVTVTTDKDGKNYVTTFVSNLKTSTTTKDTPIR